VRRPCSLLAACAGFITACGGGDGDGGADTGPQRPTTVTAGQGLRVAGDEYRFDPRRVVVIGAERPAPVRITLVNRGSLAHNLKVFREDEELGGTPTFQGGETRSGTVNLAPGSYKMVCTVGNHADLGMVGELEVRRR
jgi:plastocyanin